MLSALAACALLRLRAFGRLARQHAVASVRERPLAPRHHLSVAAPVTGLAAGLLHATQGPWSYTKHLRAGVLHLWSGSSVPSA